MTFSLNGVQLGTSIVIPAASPPNIDETTALYISGNASVRNGCVVNAAYTFNRALSAAEVLSLAQNGVAFADKWGSQTAQNVSSCANGNYTTFTGASATGFSATSNGAADHYGGTADEIVTALGKTTNVTFDLAMTSGTAPFVYLRSALNGTSYATGYQAVAGKNTVNFVTNTGDTCVVEFRNASTATSYVVSNLKVVQAGATLALEPEGIQSDKWYDSSSNNLDANYPAAGSSLTREGALQPKTFSTMRALTGAAVGGATPGAGGMAFPATWVPSADPNNHDDYDEYTAASTACTGAITTACIWKLTKSGNKVTLTLPAVQGAGVAATNFTVGLTIPSKYRPAADFAAVCAPLINNGANQSAPGAIRVTAAGVISIWLNGTFAGNFTVTANAGLAYTTSVSWTI